MSKKLITLFALTLIWGGKIPAAIALPSKLGVIRSQENAIQWTEINLRLQAAGVDYCIVNLTDLQADTNLSDLAVLFAPNIETLNEIQVARLDTWTSQGGKIIASGPTGTLSPPQVRTQLRSLLGAYWGFPLTHPATLKPLPGQNLNWARQAASSPLRGGVVIPAGLDSQTAAVWNADGAPPAVVTTDRATFLGWHWGTDVVASPQLDVSWLQATLSRYGRVAVAQDSQPDFCLASGGAIARQPPPPTPSPSPPRQTPPRPENLILERDEAPPSPRPEDLILERDPEEEDPPVAPRDSGTPIATAEAQQMRQELANLIGRWESAFLLSAAAQQDNGSMSAAIAQFLQRTEKGNTPPNNRPPAHPILAEARSQLQTFEQLLEQRNYDGARQQWENARNALLESYPTEGPIHHPEIRAVWFDRGTIVKARSKTDLAKMFDRLAAAGINTIFFETLNASYPIYPSQIAPEQNPLTQGWDPLAAAVELAHERDMELHAWVWVFAAANQRHNLLLGQPETALGPVLSLHPDWIITDREGNLFERNRKAFFDPSHPEVRQYLLSLLTEIATRYDIDGIQLDYIRYPFQDPRVNQTYGYGVASRSQFQSLTGVDPITLSPTDPLWQQWTQFRIEQVDSFVAQVSQQLRAQRPDLLLSAAVFPMPRTERFARLQQNWETWIEQGEIDLLVPMTYAIATEDLQRITEPLFAGQPAPATLVLPGIRLLRLPTSIAVDQVQLLRDLPTGGYALFAAENLGLNLETILRQTQGTPSHVSPSPLPQRQPFQAARDRYQVLQQEWLFLLQNEQLAFEERNLKQWGTQGDDLAAALQKLAEHPNLNNLQAAQRRLAAFAEQFPVWTRQQAQIQPYQVWAWENRLEAIARLLSYGDRQQRERGENF